MSELREEKKQAIICAMELRYDTKYIKELKRAKTVNELNRILRSARERM